MLDRFVALLKSESCPLVLRLIRTHRSRKKFLVESTNRSYGVSDCGLMSSGLENHPLPKGRIEVTSKLWGTVTDKELEGVLFLPVVAPREVYWISSYAPKIA